MSDITTALMSHPAIVDALAKGATINFVTVAPGSTVNIGCQFFSGGFTPAAKADTTPTPAAPPTPPPVKQQPKAPPAAPVPPAPPASPAPPVAQPQQSPQPAPPPAAPALQPPAQPAPQTQPAPAPAAKNAIALLASLANRDDDDDV